MPETFVSRQESLVPRRVSLVSLTVASIRAHLREGHWSVRLPAERELARRLRVSRPTVRAALEELERAGAIRLTGRVRRPVAGRAGVAAGDPSSRVVVLLAPWPPRAMPPTAILLIDAMRERLARLGTPLEVRVAPACFAERPARALGAIVGDRPAAAWMAYGSKGPMQRWFLGCGKPLLVIGSCAPGIRLTSVDSDFRAACRHAGDLLLRRGHRRVALVLPSDAYDGDVESEQGFREALARCPDAALRVLRHDGGASGLCGMLDRTLRSADAPTGYLVVRAVHALTVAMHLMRRGIRLPEGAAVISRDDEAYLRHTSPVLSRYAVDPGRLAREVSRAVVGLVEDGNSKPRRIRLIPEYVAGETV